MWTDYITSISHVLKVNEYGGRQAKVNEKRQCFKGWETLVTNYRKGRKYEDFMEGNITHIFLFNINLGAICKNNFY